MWPFKRRSRIHDTDEEEPTGLNPILLVPGIGGSILNAVDRNGKAERVWVRLFMADHEFRQRLWSKYNEETGTS